MIKFARLKAKNVFLIVIALLLCSGDAFAQTQPDITIEIKDENGTPLNGYLIFKAPPPDVDFYHLDFLSHIYTDRSSQIQEDIDDYYGYYDPYGNDAYHLYSYDPFGNPIDGYLGYVNNGLYRARVNTSFSWFEDKIKYNKLVYVFFFPLNDGNSLDYSNATIAQKTDNSKTGNVAWWTMYVDKKEHTGGYRLKQIVTVMHAASWTENYRFISNSGAGYFPSHNEKQSFVLEPTYNANGVINTNKPLLMVHGINGRANYWDADRSITNWFNGTNVPHELRNAGKAVWELYYGFGQEGLPQSAKMLNTAINKIESLLQMTRGCSNNCVSLI